VGVETYTLPVEFWEYRDQIIPNSVALLKGLRLYDYPGYISPYWQNTSHCLFAATNVTWETFPLWLTYMQADNPGKWNKYLTSTEFLQIIADSMSVCNLMTKNGYQYINYSWLNFSYGFL
jgi:hypothetical protein